MAQGVCANEACNCEIVPEEKVEKGAKEYCSEFCASSEGASLEDCECGHADCE